VKVLAILGVEFRPLVDGARHNASRCKDMQCMYPIQRVIFMQFLLYVFGEKLYNLCILYAARVPQGITNHQPYIPANPSRLYTWHQGVASVQISRIRLSLRCGPVAAFALSRTRAGTWSGAYPGLQDRLEDEPPLQYLFSSSSLNLGAAFALHHNVVSVSGKKWGYAHAFLRWQKPRVCHNQGSMTRARVVA